MLDVHANVEELSTDRVRLTITVSSADIKHAYEHAAADLAQNVKIPGFRKGKVPMPVLVRRVGNERIFSEAVDTHIENWFLRSAARSRLRPISRPSYDYELPTSQDADWTFKAEVEIQSPPKLVDWSELEVGKADAEIPEALVEHELDALRSSVAQLKPVEGRGVHADDTLVLDLLSEQGEASRDYVVELGSGGLDEIEQALIGMQAGESKKIPFMPAGGKGTEVEVTVKEIKEKELPPVDDELARSASEFETLAELRASIEANLLAQITDEIEAAFREASVDALVEASRFEAAGPLVDARARELLTGLARSLERRGMTIDLYLRLTGQDGTALTENLLAEARRSVARELVLEAAADQLAIEISDAEIEEFLRTQTGTPEEDVAGLISAVWEQGRQEELREDLRMSAALDRIAAEVKPIPLEQAEARKQIWTPEQEKPATTAKLWTPGSKETS